MLLGQEIIPGYEFPYMRIVYALVMLIPLLHIIAVLATPRRIRFWQRSTQLPTQMQVVRYIALPLIWNAAIAYILLVILPSAFGAKTSVILLFQPDVGWVAVISGVFAVVWGTIENWHCYFNPAPNLRKTKEALVRVLGSSLCSAMASLECGVR